MPRKSIARWLSALLPVATLVFIFSQSLLPPTVSGEESGRVAAWLASIFGETTPLGIFLVGNVRKIAHFCEYGVLGLEAVWLVRVHRDALTGVLHRTAPLWGLAVGFLDESLQCLSSRGPSIADVWLDGVGYLSLYLLLSLVLFLFADRHTKRSEKNATEQTEE